MSLDEGLCRFIGRIYEAVYDDIAWNNVIAELLTRTESRMAFLASVDIRHHEFSKSLFYGPEKSSVLDGTNEYIEEFAESDPSLIWAGEHPYAGMCDTAELMDRWDYLKHPFIVWNKSRFGSTHWRVFYTAPVDGMSFSLSLHPPANVGAAPEAVKPLHRLLYEHFERALRLAARPPDLSATTEATIVLDNAGRVLSMSPKAEALVREGDGLIIERRGLTSQYADVTARLESVIHSAINSESIGGAGGGVRLPSPSGKADWLALISPCPRFLDHLPVRTPAAILRVIEPQATACLPAQHADMFGLTPREFDVAAALLSGHSLESLCNLLGIRRNTAKIHLQALFRKTATNRQSDLIQLLSELAR